ncbi:MAG: alpha/beta hydrolase [Actinomycetota bacterium]|nr:alpha/beta hydrolase [Actinomycetota bacterium]
MRPPHVGRRTGLVSGALGVLAAGAAVGLAAERYAVGRSRTRPDPVAGELQDVREADEAAARSRVVVADDGVPLHVEEAGAPDAPVTLVFCHGFTNDMTVWHFQRRDLGDVGRLVFWDQRSHGRSGRSSDDNSTIDQLGRDLLMVLDELVPDGPVVLVGHSMGGMTVLALADHRPDLFGSRVVGVALLSTSTGKFASITFGLPAVVGRVTRRVLPFAARGVRRSPALVERGRRAGTDLEFLLTRRYSFGSKDVSPALVEMVEKTTAATPVEVIAAFYPTFVDHDKLAALDVLRSVPTVVLVGDSDLITPPDHSRAIAEALPDAELVELPAAGHMVMLEQAAMVNLHLRALVRRATRGRGTPPAAQRGQA